MNETNYTKRPLDDTAPNNDIIVHHSGSLWTSSYTNSAGIAKP